MAIKANWQEKIEFSVGDTVHIDYKIVEEGKKERTQPFEGRVISIRGAGDSTTFIVRKIGTDKVGIERIFPLNSPWIKSLKVLRKSKRKIRRAKLYYLREKVGKKKAILA